MEDMPYFAKTVSEASLFALNYVVFAFQAQYQSSQTMKND